jgi:Phosphotransferase enzyme family
LKLVNVHIKGRICLSFRGEADCTPTMTAGAARKIAGAPRITAQIDRLVMRPESLEKLEIGRRPQTWIMNDDQEYSLPGGNFDSEVVRIGDTVRRHSGPWTPGVHALLRYLAAPGFTGSPVPLGVDSRGREVLSYAHGEAGHYPLPSYMLADATLISVGKLLRSLHDLTELFPPPPRAVWQRATADPGPVEVMCHNDWAPYNAVFRSAKLVGFIDWDFARPGSRLWDFAWAAHTWVPLWDEHDAALQGWQVVPDRPRRLRLLCDVYGLSNREAVPSTIHERVLSTAQWLEDGASRGEQVFRRLVGEGHADGYRRAAHYIEDIWTTLGAAL